MAQPTTREEFRKYGRRQLGEPVVQINVAKSQEEDLIDDALQYFTEFAFEGLVRFLHAHEITQADIDNNYVETPPYILSVTKVFPMQSGNSKNPLNAPINFTLADLRHSLAGFGVVNGLDIQNFVISKQYTQMVSDLVNGEREYEFNCLQQRVSLLSPLGDLMNVGEFLLFDTYRTVDPNDFARVWNHMFLKKYYVATLKRQWGENLKKFGGMQLPGGVELNGKEIYDEAVEELNALEEDATLKWSEPPHFFTG